MALAFARALLQEVAAQTINTTVTYTSAEQDIGANTVAEQVFLYLEVDGFAAAPTGNMQVCYAPVHTTAGDAFDDNGFQFLWTVAADQQYQFASQVSGLPRYFEKAVKNNTNQNTDASAVDSWTEVTKVTA